MSVCILSVFSFLSAGCDIIETATYQASVVGLQRHLSTAEDAVDSSKALEIIGQAVEICLHARDEFWQTIKNTGKSLTKQMNN